MCARSDLMGSHTFSRMYAVLRISSLNFENPIWFVTADKPCQCIGDLLEHWSTDGIEFALLYSLALTAASDSQFPWYGGTRTSYICPAVSWKLCEHVDNTVVRSTIFLVASSTRYTTSLSSTSIPGNWVYRSHLICSTNKCSDDSCIKLWLGTLAKP